jgi:hypothetical protein
MACLAQNQVLEAWPKVSLEREHGRRWPAALTGRSTRSLGRSAGSRRRLQDDRVGQTIGDILRDGPHDDVEVGRRGCDDGVGRGLDHHAIAGQAGVEFHIGRPVDGQA